MQRLAEGINRAGADVSVNHPNRTNDQSGHGLAGKIGVVNVSLGIDFSAEVIGNVQCLLIKEGQLVFVRQTDRIVDHDIQLFRLLM